MMSRKPMKTDRLIVVTASVVALLVLVLITSGLAHPAVQPITPAGLAETDGFWSLEFNDERSYRWTNGKALFSFPGLETASWLSVTLTLTAPQYPGARPVAARLQVDDAAPFHFTIVPEWRRYHILAAVSEPRWRTPVVQLTTATWTPGVHDRRQLGIAVSEGVVQRLGPPRLLAVVERLSFLAALVMLFSVIVRRPQPYGGMLVATAVIALGMLGAWTPARLVQILPTNWSLAGEALAAAVAVETVRLRRRIPRPLVPVVAVISAGTGTLLVVALGWIVASAIFLICGAWLSALAFPLDGLAPVDSNEFEKQSKPTLVIYTIAVLIFSSCFPLITAYRYPTAYLNDDSFITLTYSKNIARGNGFVFNHPPATLGTTTPLFAIVVAGLALIFPQADIPVIAVFFTAFCWLSISWIFFFFRKEWRLGNWQVCIIALVLIGSGWIMSLGMEAYLFVLLLILCVSLFLREHYWLTGFTAGLLFLTRGEGILLLGVFSIAILIQHMMDRKTTSADLLRKILKISISFWLPVSFWFIYAYCTFGSFLPNTLAAKQAQGQSSLWNPFLRRLVVEWMPLWGKSLEILPLINLWWITVLIGFADALLWNRRWLILVGWMVFYISGYAFLGVSAYWWYQLPILFILNLLFGLGIIRFVETLVRYIKPRSFSLPISISFTLLLILAFAKPTMNLFLTYQGDSRGESYLALCRWFHENTDSSESVAFIEIGYLGYYTDNRIIDLAGLVLPDIVPYIAKGDFSYGFWRYQPDYYVYLPDFDWALAGIRADPRFDLQYQPVATLPGPRDADIVIYRRRSR